jgi:hypothetical protein
MMAAAKERVGEVASRRRKGKRGRETTYTQFY